MKGNGSVLQELVDQNAVANANVVTMEAYKFDVLSFSAAWTSISLKVVTLKGTPLNPDALSFLYVFTPGLWYTLIGMIISYAFCNWAINRLSPYSVKTEKRGNLSDSVWSSINIVLDGNFSVPRSWANKIISIYYVFMALIITATYTANLAAFLTSSKTATTISSIDDLVKSRKPWCGRSSSSSSTNTIVAYPALNQTWIPGDSATTCLALLRSGNVAAYVEYSIVADFYLNQAPCDIQTVGSTFGLRMAAFEFLKNFQVVFPLQDFSVQLSNLIADGTVEYLYDKYFVSSGQCSLLAANTLSSQALSEANLHGLFVIFPIVVAMSLAILSFEWIFKLKLESKGGACVAACGSCLSSFEDDPSPANKGEKTAQAGNKSNCENPPAVELTSWEPNAASRLQAAPQVNADILASLQEVQTILRSLRHRPAAPSSRDCGTRSDSDSPPPPLTLAP